MAELIADQVGARHLEQRPGDSAQERSRAAAFGSAPLTVRTLKAITNRATFNATVRVKPATLPIPGPPKAENGGDDRGRHQPDPEHTEEAEAPEQAHREGGRCTPGTFHTSAMASWPAWVTPRQPQMRTTMPMVRAKAAALEGPDGLSELLADDGEVTQGGVEHRALQRAVAVHGEAQDGGQ